MATIHEDGYAKSMPRRVHTLIVAALLLGVVAPLAHAQGSPEPGVSVDPDSPAGKEYALPVPSARQEAQGKTKKKSESAPLFGQGVHSSTPKKTQSPATTSASPPSTTSAAPPPAASSSGHSPLSSSSSARTSTARKVKR